VIVQSWITETDAGCQSSIRKATPLFSVGRKHHEAAYVRALVRKTMSFFAARLAPFGETN
jgi:hypothetical protein